jgi:LuxR family maltose regulon positive regulatory protein
MSLQDLVVQSQLVPPVVRKGILHRPRLQMRLDSILDHPLTIVQAGTGYGKSTALAALAGNIPQLFWYSIRDTDHDPLIFLAHLFSAFDQAGFSYGRAALSRLETIMPRLGPQALTPLLNSLSAGLAEEAVLVLDDFHILQGEEQINSLVEHLIANCPPRLHVVISTRQMPIFKSLTAWRVKGQVLFIHRGELAFTPQEVQELFNQLYHLPLTEEQAAMLADETEGWPIVLQMIWQRLQAPPGTGAAARGQTARNNLEDVLRHIPESLELLFDYLAQEVLSRQPREIQDFLLTTCVLRQLSEPACDYLISGSGSGKLLRLIHQNGLFLTPVEEGVYRYHRLFHDFLLNELNRVNERARRMHLRAAEYFARAEKSDERLYHLFEAGEYGQAATLIEEIGPSLLQHGRTESLSDWIESLPPEFRQTHPGLGVLLGDVLRLRSRFDDALECYQASERGYHAQDNRLGQSRALRGQAQVYLDTIRPLRANSLLEEALRLLEPQEYRAEVADLLDQLAENSLNLGHPDQARNFHHEARLLRAENDPDDIYLEARALLRTGRLLEARRLLEQLPHVSEQISESRQQRFHREASVLLSLVCLMQGDLQTARCQAVEGEKIGEQLDSPFVCAVAWMRLAHTYQMEMRAPWQTYQAEQALHYYRRAIDQVRAFRVMRVEVEPLWGLARYFGYNGDLAACREHASRAIEIANAAGDRWFSGLLRITLSAGLVYAGQREEADVVLKELPEAFEQVRDTLGVAAAYMWQALNAWMHEDAESAMLPLARSLNLCRQQQMDYLFTRCTMLGPRDERSLLPMLLEAQRRGIEKPYIEHLLELLGLQGIEYHPGYSLAVQTLAPFTVWRGETPVQARDWQREKARELFKLLLTFRNRWLSREQIVDRLWPDLDAEAASRDFKVALNALNRALEPGRVPGSTPFFVLRSEMGYMLNPHAGLVVDAVEFERLAGLNSAETETCDQNDRFKNNRRALEMYLEDYLIENLDTSWTFAAERERLRAVFFQAADLLAEHYRAFGRWEDLIQLGEMVLKQDTCYEPAYGFLMEAYAARREPARLRDVYKRCASALRVELDVDPSEQTQRLFKRLTIAD